MPRSLLRNRRRMLLIMVTYLCALGVVALWPVPVDGWLKGALLHVERAAPWATHARVEFVANIALFVPLGWILTGLLGGLRWAAIPAAALVSLGAESAQAVMMHARFADVRDVVANTVGACVGMLGALVYERLARGRKLSRPPDGNDASPAERHGTPDPCR